MGSYINNLLNYQNRDVAILHKGDTITVQITASLAAEGWLGGQFCRWVTDASGQPTVEIADGRYCAFFPFGSAELGDQLTAITTQNVTYKYATIFFGGNIFYTSVYEEYGYEARHDLGPDDPLIYVPNNPLYISENGKITIEDESNMVVFGGTLPNHDFPNGDPITSRFVFFGSCVTPPAASTKQYLGVQTNFGV